MEGKILIATHKEISFYPQFEPYLLVSAGSAITENNNLLNYQRDDEDRGGGQISDLNKSEKYYELTALYWGWKNLTNYNYLGLCHYSKFFTVKRKKRNWPFYQCFALSIKRAIKLAITKNEIETLLLEYDGIVKKENKFPTRINSKILEGMEIVFKKRYPEYLPSFYTITKSQMYCSQNIFIMKKDMLDKYLSFLFSFLKDFIIMNSNKFGAVYASEYLLSVWLDYHNEYKVKKIYTISSLGEKLYRQIKLVKIRIRAFKRYIGLNKNC